MLAQFTAKREPDVRGTRWDLVMIDADQGARLEPVCRLFDGFALDCRNERFAGIEMPRRLVIAESVVGFFLDEQEPSGLFYYCRYGDVRLPDIRDAHRAILAAQRAEP